MGFSCLPGNIWHNTKYRWLLVLQLILISVYWPVLCVYLGNEDWFRSKEVALVEVSSDATFTTKVGLIHWKMDGFSLGSSFHVHGFVSDLEDDSLQPVIARLRAARVPTALFLSLSIAISIFLNLLYVFTMLVKRFMVCTRLTIIACISLLIFLSHFTWVMYLAIVETGVDHPGWAYGPIFAMSVAWHIVPHTMLFLAFVDLLLAGFYSRKISSNKKLFKDRKRAKKNASAFQELSWGDNPSSDKDGDIAYPSTSMEMDTDVHIDGDGGEYVAADGVGDDDDGEEMMQYDSNFEQKYGYEYEDGGGGGGEGGGYEMENVDDNYGGVNNSAAVYSPTEGEAY